MRVECSGLELVLWSEISSVAEKSDVNENGMATIRHAPSILFRILVQAPEQPPQAISTSNTTYGVCFVVNRSAADGRTEGGEVGVREKEAVVEEV